MIPEPSSGVTVQGLEAQVWSLGLRGQVYGPAQAQGSSGGYQHLSGHIAGLERLDAPLAAHPPPFRVERRRVERHTTEGAAGCTPPPPPLPLLDVACMGVLYLSGHIASLERLDAPPTVRHAAHLYLQG